MDRFDADYFDGRSSRRQRVVVTVASGRAAITGEGVALEHAVADLRVQPRVGSTPFRIQLPGGGVLVTQADIGAVLHVPRPEGIAHRLESRVGFVVAAFAGLVAAGALGYFHGVPWLAREVAYRIPPSMEATIATEGMQELDRFVFKPSALPRERQEALRAQFARLSVSSGVPARLEFRDGGWIGANAFALPGGVVVVTDQLEGLLKDDDRIAAVLAHEVGHLEHRHGARHILQDSITGLFAAAVLGDVSSIGGLVATIPALVTHTSNSREFEREADRFAYDLLRKSGRSPRLLGEALAALEEEHNRPALDCPVELDDPPPAEEGSASEPRDPPDRPRRRARLGYLSTHPETEDRIKAAEEASK